MKSGIFVDEQGEWKEREYEIEIEGSGGDMGIKNVKYVVSQIEELAKLESAKEVYLTLHIIVGYLACCVNSGFLGKKSGEEILELAGNIAEERIRELMRTLKTK